MGVLARGIPNRRGASRRGKDALVGAAGLWKAGCLARLETWHCVTQGWGGEQEQGTGAGHLLKAEHSPFCLA